MTTHYHDHPHTIQDELHHMHDVAEKGEAAETPFILIGGVFAFIAPVLLLMLSIAFAVYYLV